MCHKIIEVQVKKKVPPYTLFTVHPRINIAPNNVFKNKLSAKMGGFYFETYRILNEVKYSVLVLNKD